MPQAPSVRAFFDEPTNTITYIVSDPATKRAAIVDPVLDYDPASGVADSHSIDAILAEVPTLSEVVDTQFAFSKKLLANQEKFAKNVVKAVKPLTRDAKPATKATAAKKAA